MKLFNIMIVDDEPRATRVLQGLIEEIYPNHSYSINCFSNPVEAIDAIRSNPPDVLFLDIEIPQISGFRLLEQVDTINFPIVFVTAHAEFAMQAIKAIAVDYLLKPVIKSELIVAFEKCIAFYDVFKNESLSKMRFGSAENFYENILTINKQQHKIVLFKSIEYLEAKSNYTVIHLINDMRIMIAKPLKYYDQLLCNQGHFFLRIHKSYIVNTAQIRTYLSDRSTSLVCMNSNTEIEVSARQKILVDRILKRK